MQAAILMAVYIVTTIVVQLIGFGISQVVSTQWPTAALTTFLLLFMASFGVAWPLAVRLAEMIIRAAGFELETEQSAGGSHRGHYSR